jgi:hypothetical protein
MEKILGDLERIAERLGRAGEAGLHYDELQRESGELHRHLLTYIRFFEDHQYLEYDRSAEHLRLTEAGHAALPAPQNWRDAAVATFDTAGSLQGHDSSSPQREVSEEPLGAGDFDAMDVDSWGLGDGLSFDTEGKSALGDSPGGGDEAISSPSTTSESNQDFSSTSSAEGQSMNDAQPSGYPESTNPDLSTPEGGGSGARLYARRDEIGSGGIGTVYHGTQVRLQRDVAIKEIREIFHVFADVQRQDIVTRFEEIVQEQAQISHANIVDIVDVDPYAEYPFVVMEYAPRGNLRRLIEHEGRPPLDVALKYFLQILHALSAAHDAELVHGGIKPENIVIDGAGNAKLTDFGMSSVVERDSSNQVYVGVGTVAYMSPEQFRDPNAASVVSDIYSLGIMFYEMLTGKVPGRRSPMPSSFYPDIPRKLDDIFDRMSMDSEEDRYPNIDEILRDFYSSDDVMEILDKRSGVLFLRDPLEYGTSGLGEEVELSPSESAPESGSYVPAEAGATDGGAAESYPLDEVADEEVSEAASERVTDEEPAEEVEAAAESGDEVSGAEIVEEGPEEASEATEEGAEDEETSEPEEGGGESSSDEDNEDGDVLGKLDKYGKLFD